MSVYELNGGHVSADRGRDWVIAVHQEREESMCRGSNKSLQDGLPSHIINIRYNLPGRRDPPLDACVIRHY